MKNYNLYRMGRYGWFHVTSFKFETLEQAINFYKKDFHIKIGNNIGQYKVTGI